MHGPFGLLPRYLMHRKIGAHFETWGQYENDAQVEMGKRDKCCNLVVASGQSGNFRGREDRS